MYYAWDNCDVLNQFIEKKMNLLTNFPIFKNENLQKFVWQITDYFAK